MNANSSQSCVCTVDVSTHAPATDVNARLDMLLVLEESCVKVTTTFVDWELNY